MKVIVIATSLLLTACSYEVQIHHLKSAEQFCADHGGVARMWSAMGSWHSQCVDGTRQYKAGETK